MLKNMNKIHRSTYVSCRWGEVHIANDFDFRPNRKGGVLACFYITRGINKKGMQIHHHEGMHDNGINDHKSLINVSDTIDDFD